MNRSSSELMSELNEHQLFSSLTKEDQEIIQHLSEIFSFTFQEKKFLIEMACDLVLWQAEPLCSLANTFLSVDYSNNNREGKKAFLNALRSYRLSTSSQEKSYPNSSNCSIQRNNITFVESHNDNNIFGKCPVASEKTVCCNLKTIDAVQNCAFGCSYCTIQTFYGEKVTFNKDLKDKLKKLTLESDQYYHIGTGQSSDSLVWGNKFNLLDDLCEFAANNPNVLLEFKTKSANITYFLQQKVPDNIVCSWTINTPNIIENEEHFTASLEKRLDAAYKLASHGVKIAFHFHPMVYYKNWEFEYSQVVKRILEKFNPDTVLFVSIGSVTFIKPVLKKIRERGTSTKITQMEMVPDPHGRLTYPDEIKLKQFRLLHDTFSPWHSKVFFYLCMEKAALWDGVFGFHYATNEIFENDFGKEMQRKIDSFSFLDFD